MGCTQSQFQPATDAIAPEIKNMSKVIEVDLKKHRPGCTGMFWRSDPTGATSLASNDNWPRDGAKLRGYVVTTAKNGEKWLLATEVLQANSCEWVPAPAGAAMPFEYNNHYSLEESS